MSGRKRALVGLDARMTEHLAQFEERLSSVSADYQAVQARISAMQTEEETRTHAAFSARQQAVSEITRAVEGRFQDLETSTACAIREQEAHHRERGEHLAVEIQETNITLARLAHELDQRRADEADAWQVALETLEAAQSLEQALHAYYPAGLWEATRVRSQAWLEEAEANLYRGQAEAALLAAQQAYLDLQEQRLVMEEHFRRQHRLRLSALQRLNEVVALAEANAAVQAVDLDGNFLETWIEVNRWSGGLLGRVHQRARALLQQVSRPYVPEDEPAWAEVLEEQIPTLEQGVCDAVGMARRAVLNAQLRFNIAERVVAALAVQGYSLKHSGWHGAQPGSYLASLHDYSGSEVVVRLSPGPADSTQAGGSQAYQLDISYHSEETVSDHILQRSVNEIFTSLRRAGLRVTGMLAAGGMERRELPPEGLLSRRQDTLQLLNR